jgi:AcrR family transcriptional regulator
MSSSNGSETPYRRSLLKQERSRETRQRLAHAAVRLWRAQAFGDVSVAEICKEAGVVRSTFYLHFEKKEDVLGELTFMTIEGVERDLAQKAASSKMLSLSGALDVFVDGLARRAMRLPKQLLLANVTRGMAGIARIGHFDRPDFGSVLGNLFEDAQGRGELDGQHDPRECGAILGAMLMECLLRWAHQMTPNQNLAQLLRERARIFLYGVTNPPVEPSPHTPATGASSDRSTASRRQ